ncbi:MAG: hypothetical protein LBU38_05905, partial [Propionibacteriaceae bacterium]|nr:hypothetical protein [Propionibacteriaceae bacterium]
LIFGTTVYLKETGDFSILDEQVDFDNDPTLARPLFEHLVASWRHVVENLGPHGLPLIGRADWNDCLNLNCFSDAPGESFQTTANSEGRVAESVFIAGMFTAIAPELSELASRRGENALAAAIDQDVAKMRQAIHDHGWDGAWFRRAYDAFGAPVGSIENEEGKIYIEPQGMCIMGGNGLDDGRAKQALDSVAERLACDHGIAILAPAYTGYHLELGEISSYPPGYKENGGVFCHNNPWIFIAETIAGDPARAFDYYRKINPVYREPISDLHGLEPYAFAQMIAGPQAPNYGQAKNSWLTGTAAWVYVAVTQHLIGIRPGFDGLIIDPKLTEVIGGYEVTRRYRDATYHVQVRAGGTGTLSVDGQEIPGNVIPMAAAGTVVNAVWE